MLKTKTTSRAAICVTLIYALTVDPAPMVMFMRLLLGSNGNMKTLSASNAINLNQNISSKVDYMDAVSAIFTYAEHAYQEPTLLEYQVSKSKISLDRIKLTHQDHKVH